MTFASLKEVGLVAELSSEQARIFIAEKRVLAGLSPQETLALSDQDQLEIMRRQVELDELLVKACGSDVFIISDTSPLNAVLYMSPNFRFLNGEVGLLAKRSLAITTATFYAHPIYRGWSDQQDPNRVHDYKQSQAIDSLIPKMLEENENLRAKTVPISGSTTDRLLAVKTRIFR